MTPELMDEVDNWLDLRDDRRVHNAREAISATTVDRAPADRHEAYRVLWGKVRAVGALFGEQLVTVLGSCVDELADAHIGAYEELEERHNKLARREQEVAEELWMARILLAAAVEGRLGALRSADEDLEATDESLLADSTGEWALRAYRFVR